MFRNTVEHTLLDRGVDLRVVLTYLGKGPIAHNPTAPDISTDHVLQELNKVQMSE